MAKVSSVQAKQEYTTKVGKLTQHFDMNIAQFEEDVVRKAKVCYRAFERQLRWMTWEDLAQELRLALLLNLHRHDSSRGANLRTFASRIMDYRLRDILRENHCTVRAR
jgi:DNA-directed RNA polymerase specialized sigma24 family protein